MIDIYNEDCLVGMHRILDKSIDCIICDLPYGTTSLKWDAILPMDLLWEQYNRLIKPNGAIVLFGIEPFTSMLICSNIKHFREKLTWVKPRPCNPFARKTMHMKYSEDIIVFSKGKNTFNPQMEYRVSDRVRRATKNDLKPMFRDRGEGEIYNNKTVSCIGKLDPNLKYSGNVLYYPNVRGGSKEKVAHPCQKPLALIERLVLTYTNPGDRVLDNCMGSGTTGVACLRTGRHFIGFEKEESYYKIAEQRINDETR